MPGLVGAAGGTKDSDEAKRDIGQIHGATVHHRPRLTYPIN